MLKQISILTKAQMMNFCGINEFRYTKDRKKKGLMVVLGTVWLMLVVMLCGYTGSMAYGYIILGLSDIFPMYLALICAIIIFFFSMLKAGSVLFAQRYYESLCSLPVTQTAIVASRYLSMYVGNIFLCLFAMVPAMTVYGFLLKPGLFFYVRGMIGTLFLPMIPMTASVIFGALIAGIASRMKHKSLVTTVLMVLFLFGTLGLSGMLAGLEGKVSEDMLYHLAEMISAMIEKTYPPAVWFGNLMIQGSWLDGLFYFGASVAIFGMMLLLVSRNFKNICQNLFSVRAKHDYKMGRLKKESVKKALYVKEARRYFSSSVYVSNTIIGPIMMVIFAGTVWVMGIEKLEIYLPIPGGLSIWIPWILGGINCIMTTTCTSVSMEGKEWWIVKSLPIETKALLDSKLLLNISLIAPFYVISEVLLIVALKPDWVELLWLVVLPAVFTLFCLVFGITMNLLLPLMNWENEARVVKQSASSFLGGFGGCLVVVLSAVPMILCRNGNLNMVRLVMTVLMVGVTVLLYHKNNKVDLRKI